MISEFQSTLPVRGATWRLYAENPNAEFQSTLPVRGATGNDPDRTSIGWDFNPRSP